MIDAAVEFQVFFYSKVIVQRKLLAHVADTAFYFFRFPKYIKTRYSGGPAAGQ